MSKKIDESELMSYKEFSKLTDAQKKKAAYKSKILELERQRKSEEVQEAKKIRVEILAFAYEEILPLIEINPTVITRNKKFDTLIKVQEENKRLKKVAIDEANEMAFISSLKLFMLHDIRLKGGLTLEFISVILGITRERVRQVETNVMRKLKHPNNVREFFKYVHSGNSTYTSDF